MAEMNAMKPDIKRLYKQREQYKKWVLDSSVCRLITKCVFLEIISIKYFGLIDPVRYMAMDVLYVCILDVWDVYVAKLVLQLATDF